MSAGEGQCRVTVIPGGPMLLRGADVVQDGDGNSHPVTRPVVAVCVCRLSQRQPWCDGTHKVAVNTPRSNPADR
jgi:CDGSH-type Zn-finger protein